MANKKENRYFHSIISQSKLQFPSCHGERSRKRARGPEPPDRAAFARAGIEERESEGKSNHPENASLPMLPFDPAAAQYRRKKRASQS
jgi:hypothetical protein